MTSAVSSASSQSRLVEWVSPRFFYGWVIVAVGFIAQMLTSISSQGLTTYVTPLQREFGWSAAETAAGRSFQQTDAFLGPLNGWLVDKLGPRLLMSVGVVLYSVSFVLFSQVNSLFTYYAVCLIMAVANSLIGMLVVSTSLNLWFRRRRSTAQGIAATGLATAGALFIPLIVWVQSYGWRYAALGTAAGVLVLGLPIFLLMRSAPERYGLLPDGETPAAADGRPRSPSQFGGGLVSFTVGQAIRTPAYWCIAGGLALFHVTQAAVLVHQFPHLEALLSRETAALVLSVLNLFSMAGRLIGGLLGDRLVKHRLLGVNLIGSAVAVLLLAYATSLPGLLVYGALFGWCWGVRTAVANSLLGDYFGRVAFGRILGLTQLLVSPASILAPILVGLAADVLGGYQTAFGLLAISTGAAATLFLLARRPAAPASGAPAG